MIADRYYYGKLTDREKKIYKAFYEGLKKLDSQIKTLPVPNPDGVMGRIFEAIIADNPHIYYVDGTKIKYRYSVTELVIIPTYVFTKSRIIAYNQQIQQEANRIATVITKNYGSNQLQKETALYNFFSKKFRYDERALVTKDPIHICKAHSMLGVFLEGTAVCEGFAKAFKFIMNAMDMKCIVVHGQADFQGGSAHAWNIVKIENKAYHVDPTWAMCISEKDYVRYDYLNLSDEAISVDHRDFKGYPKCNNDDMDYYKANGMEVDNSIHLKNYIKKAMKRRESSTEFKLVKGTGKCGFTGNEDLGTVVSEACKRAAKEVGIGAQFQMQFVEKKMTCRIEFNYS